MPYQIACVEGVMDGLYLLWWVQEKHIPPALVATTMAAGDLAVMLLEVPTGWFADRFGNRRSLILGSIIQVAGMCCCWLADGVPALVTACVLVAFGDAFRSGADHALLYRTCVAVGREHEFQRIEARSRAVQVVVLAALTVGGGVIVSTRGFAAGWIAETVLCALGFAIACAMVEPPACEPEADETAASRLSIPWRHAALVILPVACLGAATAAGSFVLQTTGTNGAAEVSVLVAIITLADAAGSALAMRVPAAGSRGHITLLLAGAVVVAGALMWPAALTLATITLAFAAGLAYPLRAASIQRMATDAIRARAASLASACDMGMSTIVLLITGSRLSRR